MFSGFQPMYTVGESRNMTVFHVAGGNAAHRCQCDLDRDLLQHVVANQAAYNAKMMEVMVATSDNPLQDQITRSCQIDLTVGKVIDASTVTEGSNYIPDLVKRRSCRRMTDIGGESCCTGSPTNPNPHYEPLTKPILPIGVNFYDVRDAVGYSSATTMYLSGDYDNTCPRTAAFGLSGCDTSATYADTSGAAYVNATKVKQPETACDYAASCVAAATAARASPRGHA